MIVIPAKAGTHGYGAVEVSHNADTIVTMGPGLRRMTKVCVDQIANDPFRLCPFRLSQTHG